MQFACRAIHLALKRSIDGALLLHTVLAGKAGVDHFGCEMGTVVALHSDFGVGKAFAQQGLDLVGGDGHGGVLWSG